jgi:hypothetical protein
MSDNLQDKNGTTAAIANLPDRLLADLMQTRTLPGEDPELLKRFSAQVLGDVQPQDMIEQTLVGDFIHAAWEVLRLRRYKDGLLQARARRGLVPILAPVLKEEGMAELVADNWYSGAPGRVQDVVDFLSEVGLTMHAAMAQTLAMNLDTFERMDDLLERAEKRRAAATRDLRGHREALALEAQKAVQKIEDADFKTIPDPDTERLKRHVVRR